MARPVRCRDKWRIRWFDAAGERRSAVFASYKEAEFQLRRREAEAEEIRRGLRDAPPPEHTFGELCDYWLKNRAIHKRSEKDDRSIIARHLRPAFGALPLRELGVAQIDSYRAARAGVNKKTLSNQLTLLLSMLNAAVDLGWLTKVPRIRKPSVRLFSTDFRYLRTDDEVRRLLVAAWEDGADAHALYATAVYTGLRQGELAGLTWDAVEFERRLLVVQRSFDGPTKAGDVRYVPILDVLLPILRAWRLQCPGRIVFPNRDGGMHLPSARIFQERFHRVLDAGGFERPPAGTRAKHAINFHALRHTFASHWVMKCGDIFKLQKILGHKSIQMTMRYAHLAPTAFADDLDRLSPLAAPRPSDAVDLGKAEARR